MVERLITSEDEQKKAMQATCKYLIKAINRNDDNCPILMEKITFDLFSHYTSMKKIKKSGVYLSATIYEGIRSALTSLYRASGNDMDQLFKKELSYFILVMKRVIASNKKQYGISL